MVWRILPCFPRSFATGYNCTSISQSQDLSIRRKPMAAATHGKNRLKQRVTRSSLLPSPIFSKASPQKKFWYGYSGFVPPKHGKAPVSVAQEDGHLSVRAIAEFQVCTTSLHHPVLVVLLAESKATQRSDIILLTLESMADVFVVDERT